MVDEIKGIIHQHRCRIILPKKVVWQGLGVHLFFPLCVCVCVCVCMCVCVCVCVTVFVQNMYMRERTYTVYVKRKHLCVCVCVRMHGYVCVSPFLPLCVCGGWGWCCLLPVF